MIKNDILNGKFDNMFCTLYGSTEDARERYAATVEKFSGLYDSTQDIRLFSAPGRTEVGGNHT
ncbi:MAG: galactokinase family protein, partial [Oscillospiraceae bacterium]